MTWGRYLIRRLMLLVFIVAGITVVTFVLTRIIPGEPAAIYVGPLARPEQIEEATRKLGLDQPLHVQYGRYVSGLAQGDLGTSLRTHRPVLDDIRRFLPGTLELILAALGVALVAGVGLGALSARYRGSWLDHGVRLLSIAGVSLPSFWLALLLQVVFFRLLGWLPVGGRMSIMLEQTYPVTAVTHFMLIDSALMGNWVAFADAARHMVLPALALAAYPIGVIARMTRAAMIEVLQQEYVRAVRAYGLPWGRITFVYALKNALSPVLTIVGLTFAYLLTGAFFVELIFNWPGLGTYAVRAILSTDYPAIMGVTIVVSLFYVFINLVVDLLQMWLDPRISLR